MHICNYKSILTFFLIQKAKNHHDLNKSIHYFQRLLITGSKIIPCSTKNVINLKFNVYLNYNYSENIDNPHYYSLRNSIFSPFSKEVRRNLKNQIAAHSTPRIHMHIHVKFHGPTIILLTGVWSHTHTHETTLFYYKYELCIIWMKTEINPVCNRSKIFEMRLTVEVCE